MHGSTVGTWLVMPRGYLSTIIKGVKHNLTLLLYGMMGNYSLSSIPGVLAAVPLSLLAVATYLFTTNLLHPPDTQCTMTTASFSTSTLDQPPAAPSPATDSSFLQCAENFRMNLACTAHDAAASVAATLYVAACHIGDLILRADADDVVRADTQTILDHIRTASHEEGTDQNGPSVIEATERLASTENQIVVTGHRYLTPLDQSCLSVIVDFGREITAMIQGGEGLEGSSAEGKSRITAAMAMAAKDWLLDYDVARGLLS